MSLSQLFKFKRGESCLTRKAEKRIGRLNTYAEEEKLDSALNLLELIFPEKDFAHLPEKIIYEICEIIGELHFYDDYEQATAEISEHLTRQRNTIKTKRKDATRRLREHSYHLSKSGKSYIHRNSRNGDWKEWVSPLLEELDVHYLYGQYSDGYHSTRDQIYNWLIAELDRVNKLIKDVNK